MYLFSKCLVPKGLQEKVQETLELELQTVAASMWVLKIEFRFSGRAASALIC